MGLFKKIASAMGRFRGNMRILVVGLDNSGKSTLIEHIKPNKVNAVRYRELISQRICGNAMNKNGVQLPGLSRLQLCRCNIVPFTQQASSPSTCCIVEILPNKEGNESCKIFTHSIHQHWRTEGHDIEPTMISRLCSGDNI